MFCHVFFAALSVLLLGIHVQTSFAQSVNFDRDPRFAIVDGNVSDSLAADMIEYSQNLYDRGDYTQSISNLRSLIRVYSGVELGRAYLLRGKSRFMDGRLSPAYKDFLYLFDRFRGSPPVQDGELVAIISTALDRLVNLANLSPDKCCDEIDFDYLDHTIRFYELYKYVSGTPSLEIVEAALSAKYTKKLTLTRVAASLAPGGKCYEIDVRKKAGGMEDVALAMLITNVALDEWRYMGLLKDRTCVLVTQRYYSGNTRHYLDDRLRLGHRSLAVGDSVAIWINGKQLSGYEGMLRSLKNVGNREFTIEVKGDSDVRFTVRGPASWKFKGLAWDRKIRKLSWHPESYMGPLQVEFVVRDLIVARHGSLVDWIGLSTRRKVRDNL